MAIQAAVGVVTGDSSMRAEGRVRSNFAGQHLLAANRFSRHVSQVEMENEGKEFGEFYEAVLHFSTACILSATSALEAYINETFYDRGTLLKPDALNILDGFSQRYEGDFERAPLLSKYQLIAFAQGGPPLPAGQRPYQDVATLVELRNALIHFRPEWEPEAGRHGKLSKRLRDAGLRPTPFIPDPEGLFPRRWATYGSTAWAVRSCVEFAAAFQAAASLPPKFPPISPTN